MTNFLLAALLEVVTCAAPELGTHHRDTPRLTQVQIHQTQSFPSTSDGFRFVRYWIGGEGIRVRPSSTQEEQRLESEEILRSMQPLVMEVSQRLREALGPVWQVESESGAGITIAGPILGGGDESQHIMRVTQAVTNLSDAFIQAQRAKELPAGAEKTAAEGAARKAASAADEAMASLRAETVIIPLQRTEGEDVAKALKAALPWGTFASVGGSQIVATGSKTELDVAKQLVAKLEAELAADMERAKRDESSEESNSPAARILQKPIDIDFPGGLLPDYLGTLAKTAGAESWVVEDPRLAKAVLPRIKLTGVTADNAVLMLGNMSLSGSDDLVPANTVIQVERINPVGGTNQETPPIYRIGTFNPQSRQPTRPASPTLTEVFDVALTQFRDTEGGEAKIKSSHENLLAAIEAGTSVLGPSKLLKVKLHAPSGMLFASGTPEEMALIRSIVQQWSSTQ